MASSQEDDHWNQCESAGEDYGQSVAETTQTAAIAHTQRLECAAEAVPEVKADHDHGDHIPKDLPRILKDLENQSMQIADIGLGRDIFGAKLKGPNMQRDKDQDDDATEDHRRRGDSVHQAGEEE